MVARKKARKPKGTAHAAHKYTKEIHNEVCWRIAQGETLTAICEPKHMPDASAVSRWAMEGAKIECRDKSLILFAQDYRRARDLQAILFADRVQDIADQTSNDLTHDGRPNTAAVQRDKLRIDAMKWRASKLAPHLYGERIGVEHSGPGGGPIEHVNHRDLARTLIEVMDTAALELAQEATPSPNPRVVEAASGAGGGE